LNNDEIDELLLAAKLSKANHTPNHGPLEDARRHLENCASCQSRMRAHELAMEQIAFIKPNARATKGPDCPPGDVWLDIAAGFADQDSEKYLNHAAECDHCGPFLRDVKEDFADDLTPEEALHVASLPSANTDWQRRLAQSLGSTLEHTTPEPEGSTRLTPAWYGKRLSWKLPVLALAAIILTAIAVSIGVRLLRPASVDELLATAYTERRTLDVRIPGAQSRSPDQREAPQKSQRSHLA
jgi:hypothetical protein